MQESRSAKFGPDFRLQSPLTRSAFKTDQHIRNLKGHLEY